MMTSRVVDYLELVGAAPVDTLRIIGMLWRPAGERVTPTGFPDQAPDWSAEQAT
jgi:hypothetical protein